jgi:hypothetical protein
MTKARVARHILERMALAELRARQGCENIIAIEIEYVSCGKGGNWRICTVNFGDAKVIQHPRDAVEIVSGKLRQQYNLLTDS